MPDLVIKPTAGAGNKLILQDQGGGTGAIIENATITVPTLKLTPGSAPGSPTEGTIYYNSTDNALKVYNGSEWRDVSGLYASGGTITTMSGYIVHTFTKGGTFVVYGGSLTVDILLVGGGGSSGAEYAGGGGAGGVLWGQSIVIPEGENTIVIGAGGSSPTGSGSYDTIRNDGDNGDNSTFTVGSTVYTALGGGGGDGYDNISENGKDGGSGGGNSLYVNETSHDEASSSTQTAPNASWTAYGNGGSATATYNPANRGGTGGGGAGGAGGVNTSGGDGGPGGVGLSTLAGLTSTETSALLWSAQIGTNSSNALVSGLGSNPGTIYFAGGGSGNSHQGTNNIPGGLGGGGTGMSGTTFNSIMNGLGNTGSGGGASEGYSATGGAGGSGFCIVRYAV